MLVGESCHFGLHSGARMSGSTCGTWERTATRTMPLPSGALPSSTERQGEGSLATRAETGRDSLFTLIHPQTERFLIFLFSVLDTQQVHSQHVSRGIKCRRESGCISQGCGRQSLQMTWPGWYFRQALPACVSYHRHIANDPEKRQPNAINVHHLTEFLWARNPRAAGWA